MASDSATGLVFLIGGGWDPAAGRRHYGALLAGAHGLSSGGALRPRRGPGDRKFGRGPGR